jgi:acyl-coenzyme A thioesterase PaaI-like protein
MMKTEKRTVRTSHGIREYTYLGCPLTRNRSPWCFRLCMPDGEGHGECGRVAPHGFKSRIQLGIEAHKEKQLEDHRTKLERMYLAAPGNQFYEPGVSILDGAAEIVIPIQEQFLEAARSVDASVCFRAMDDAARLAVSSTIRDVAVATSTFSINMSRPVSSGELIARARLVAASEVDFLAEAVLTDAEGQELARGTGEYVKSSVPLSAEIGYS